MISTPGQNILTFIKHFISEHGYSPTLTEIKDGIGYKSRGTTYRYVCQLIDEGLLANQKNEKRGLRLKHAKDFQPLMGQIVAGSPLEAIPDPDQINFLDKFKIPGLYWLKVSEEAGDSMIEANIYPGDFVGVAPAKKARNYDIVVALVDKSETTLKTFYQCKSYIELRPENPNYIPQRYSHDRVDIQGIHKITVSFR